jgi:selenocysteine lyase/cysteine desulfurase
MDRRQFFERLLGGTALSLYALRELNGAIYDSINSLNDAYQQVPSPDGAYWDAVKKHYLMENNLIMMNNGTVGPIPQPVYNTMMEYFKVQMTTPSDLYTYFPAKVEEVRYKLANFANVSSDEVAITRNTTEGLNFVANGLDMKEGDEVLMSNLEHPSMTNAWRLKAKRYGIKVTEVPLGVPPKSVEEIVDAFRKAITPRTKIIAVAHTIFITGLITPLKELSDLAHKNGLLILADSAHGIGMMDLKLHDWGVDFYASSPYKWLGAPPEAGFFYVRKDVQDKLWPTIGFSGWDTYKTAKRFETFSQRADALVMGLGEALNFQTVIGKSRIERRVKSLASYLKSSLRDIPGFKLHTNTDEYLSAGLTAFSIKGVNPENVVNHVREKYNIVVRTIGNADRGTLGVRVSTHIFVSTKDIDLLVQGVREVARNSGA